MSLSKEDLAKVARLARLQMTDDELEQLQTPMNAIIGFIEQLSEVDTDNVVPLPSGIDIPLRTRANVNDDGDCRDKVLANAPETLEGFFVVPKVVE